MDPRLLRILSKQREAGFPGLAGSAIDAAIRVSEALLNELLGGFFPAGGALRGVTIHPHAGNRLGVRVTLAKPAFLPPMTLGLAIERQPRLPADPVLVLELTGAAGMLRLVAPAITGMGLLPHGVRFEDGRFFVDVRLLLLERGQADLLDHLSELQITSEEGAVVVKMVAQPRPAS